ncbi:MAG: isoprenylcysteine carboxylmethyltransferase family protein [Symploca sp. SIO2E6]|nr:isoprenylcysteine carboxylmethyltransferase family protein [Symploca sp. SIO2E6]
MLILKCSALILLTICCLSFSWGSAVLFARPEGATKGFSLNFLLDSVLMIIQFIAIIKAENSNLIIGVIGLNIYIISLALFWWAVKTTKDKPLSLCYSQDLPSYIITTGPYKLIRNPFYTSYLLPMLAGVLVTDQLWLLITLVVMLIPLYKAACQEEAKFSDSSFAAEYKAYKERTGMFLPNLFSFSTPTASSSIEN